LENSCPTLSEITWKDVLAEVHWIGIWTEPPWSDSTSDAALRAVVESDVDIQLVIDLRDICRTWVVAVVET
jgi:hypothetical protein